MIIRTAIFGLAAVCDLALLQACHDTLPVSLAEAIVFQAPLDLALCAPDRGGFTLASSNPYFPLDVGREWVLQGEEGGAAIELRITVLDVTETVAGVSTHVVQELESADGVLVEDSRNFFVEASDGTVCYFGEHVDIYEGGTIVSHEGSWRADDAGNRPGIIMPAHPRAGVKFQMEGAPGIAEDQGAILGGGRVSTPAGTFTKTIRVRESDPLDGSRDNKVFAQDVGVVIDGTLALVSNK